MKLFKHKKRKKMHELSIEELKTKYVKKRSNAIISLVLGTLFLVLGAVVLFFMVDLIAFTNSFTEQLLLLGIFAGVIVVVFVLLSVLYWFFSMDYSRDADICEIMIFLKEKLGE